MKKCLFLIALKLVIISAFAIDSRNPVQQYLDSIQNRFGFPGACVSFSKRGEPITSVASGWADKEAGVKMKAKSVMLSGSAPKMLYATVALQMTEQGEVDLERKVASYLGKKAWYKRIPNSDYITIRHLLNHSSGIMEYYPLGDFLEQVRNDPDKSWKPEELLSYVFDQQPLFEAGTDFSYADTNYILLGVIIEQITHRSIFELVNNAIVTPLEMSNTRPALSRKIDGLVNGYQQPNSPFGFGATSMKDGQLVFNPQFEWCGGGYVSTTEDWVKFISGLMKTGLISEDARSNMMTGIECNLGPGQKYGLGLQVRPSNLGVGFGHGGWFPGYLTEVEYFLDEDIAIAIQFNTDDFSKIGGHPRSHLLAIARLIKSEAR